MNTYTVEFYNADTDAPVATVRVAVDMSESNVMDALQVVATARLELTNASGRVLSDDGKELAAYGHDEIEEFWA